MLPRSFWGRTLPSAGKTHLPHTHCNQCLLWGNNILIYLATAQDNTNLSVCKEGKEQLELLHQRVGAI